MGSPERIAVVGAGIIGCATAFELSRRGIAVTLFDERGIGAGATQASAGILAPFTEAHAGGPLFDLTVRGLAAYDAFVGRVRESAGTDFEYRAGGTIEVAFTAGDAGRLRARLDQPWASSADLEWLDPDAVRARVPLLSARAAGGLLCRAHRYIAVRAFVAAIAEAARQQGATIATGVRVQSVTPGSDTVQLVLPDRREGFDRVVLTAGAWTPLLDPTGESLGRVTPVRGQLVRLTIEPDAIRHVLWSNRCYLVPWTDGTLLVGATSEVVGFEERVTAAGVRELIDAACELVPALASATFRDVLVGLRPGTSDGMPLLGPSRDPRIIYAAGHYRNGILLAPLTAVLIAEYVSSGHQDPSFRRS